MKRQMDGWNGWMIGWKCQALCLAYKRSTRNKYLLTPPILKMRILHSVAPQPFNGSYVGTVPKRAKANEIYLGLTKPVHTNIVSEDQSRAPPSSPILTLTLRYRTLGAGPLGGTARAEFSQYRTTPNPCAAAMGQKQKLRELKGCWRK